MKIIKNHLKLSILRGIILKNRLSLCGNKNYEKYDWYYDILYEIACIELKQKNYKKCEQILKELLSKLGEFPIETLSKKLLIKLILCHYTMGICYQNIKENLNSKAELQKAYKIITEYKIPEISEKLISHIEKCLKFGFTKTN